MMAPATNPLEYKRTARRTIERGFRSGGIAAQLAYAWQAPSPPKIADYVPMGSFQHAVWRVQLEWPANAPAGVPLRLYLKAFIGSFCVWQGSGANLAVREQLMQDFAAGVSIPVLARRHITYKDMSITVSSQIVGPTAAEHADTEHFVEVAKALAALHAAKPNAALCEALPDMGLKKLCSAIRQTGRKAKRTDICELADLAERALADEAAPQAVPTHGDPHLNNWIVNTDGSIGALLDFEDAALSEPARDLAIALRSFEVQQLDPASFLAAYEEAGGAHYSKLNVWRALLNLQDAALAIRLEQEILFGKKLPQTDVKRWLSFLRDPIEDLEEVFLEGAG